MNRTKKFLQLNGWVSLLLVMVILAACSPAETPPAAPTDAAEALSILPASGASQEAVPETGSSAEASAKVELETELSQLQIAADSAPETVDSDAAPAGEMPAAEGEEQPAAQVEFPPFEGPLPPVDPSIGNLAPDFSLTTLDGETVSLADLRGRPAAGEAHPRDQGGEGRRGRRRGFSFCGSHLRGAGDMRLTDDILKTLGTVFSRQDQIGHAGVPHGASRRHL